MVLYLISFPTLSMLVSLYDFLLLHTMGIEVLTAHSVCYPEADPGGGFVGLERTPLSGSKIPKTIL